MQIHIEGHEPPGRRCQPGPDAPDGHTGLRVGVQRRGDPTEILGLVSGELPSPRWTVECVAVVTEHGIDFKGPYVQGRPHDRFIYLSWLSDQGPGPLGMFRRGKIRLDSMPEHVAQHAVAGGDVIVRMRLSDDKGNPACATLGASSIAWTAC